MSDLNQYSKELKRAMEILAKDERVLFLGQTVEYPGSRFTYKTLEGVPLEKRLELPIMEDTQMGASIGLSLQGYIPVSIYPRMDFLILATNQIANHLDKMSELSRGQYNPKVIIRSVIGSRNPTYPGPQHCQDYVEQFRGMLENIDVVKLTNSEMIVPEYVKALESKKSTMLIELGDLHI